MPQASDLNFPFRAVEVVDLGTQGLGQGLSRRDRERIVMDALDRADVVHLATRSYQSLSGGERQRVHFARVLAQLAVGRTVEKHQILFLDEPIASLDLRHQLRVLAEARRLAETGVAVVAVLHDLQLVSELADDLILLAGGRRIASGPAADVLTADTLAQVFGVKARSSVLPPMPWTAL